MAQITWWSDNYTRCWNLLRGISLCAILLINLIKILSENITEEIINKGICRVVGDGAFMKGNEPFKKSMSMRELLSNEGLQFRWGVVWAWNMYLKNFFKR